jgi:hypothetical protein
MVRNTDSYIFRKFALHLRNEQIPKVLYGTSRTMETAEGCFWKHPDTPPTFLDALRIAGRI